MIEKYYINKIFNDECVAGIKKRIPDNSIDLIYTDLPYGMTNCVWDKKIDLGALWEQYNRVLKPSGVVVLTASQPFTSELVMSNLKNFRHEVIWEKCNGSNFYNVKKAPLKVHESVLVFYKNKETIQRELKVFKPVQDYLQQERKKTGKTLKEFDQLLNTQMAGHYFADSGQWSVPSEKAYKLLQTTGYFKKPYSELRAEYKALNAATPSPAYTPQMQKGKPYSRNERLNFSPVRQNKAGFKDNISNIKHKSPIDNKGERFPRSVVKINKQTGQHPTQKPVDLAMNIINTYSNKGDIVLDSCVGSGTTIEGCILTDRNCTAFELTEHYYNIALEREKAVYEREIISAFLWAYLLYYFPQTLEYKEVKQLINQIYNAA